MKSFWWAGNQYGVDFDEMVVYDKFHGTELIYKIDNRFHWYYQNSDDRGAYNLHFSIKLDKLYEEYLMDKAVEEELL